MDKSDITFVLLLGVFYGWAAMCKYFFVSPVSDILSAVGIVFVIGGLFLQNYYMLMITSPYRYLRITTRPTNRTLHCFCAAITTKQVSSGFYATMLSLAFPIEWAPYGRVRKLVINHELPWEKRVNFQTDKAIYNGYVIDHPNSCYLTAYEKAEGGLDMDHSEPIIVMALKEAPGDYYIPSISQGSAITPSNTSDFTQQKLLKRLQDMDHTLGEKSREAMDWHQKAMQAEEAVDHLKNEILSLLKLKGDFKESVVEYILTIREAHLKIENFKVKGKYDQWQLTKYMAMVMIATLIVAYIWANPPIAQQVLIYLFNPVTQIMIAAIVIGVLIYIYKTGGVTKNK